MLSLNYNLYWFFAFLLPLGLYIVLLHSDPVKQLLGLGVMQSSVFLLYIMLAYVEGGAPPILVDGGNLYANPLPHVLILTAIVVAVATLALGLSLINRLIQHDEKNRMGVGRATPPSRQSQRS